MLSFFSKSLMRSSKSVTVGFDSSDCAAEASGSISGTETPAPPRCQFLSQSLDLVFLLVQSTLNALQVRWIACVATTGCTVRRGNRNRWNTD